MKSENIETMIKNAATVLGRSADNIRIQGNEIRYRLNGRDSDCVIQFDPSDDFSQKEELQQELEIAVIFAADY